nr:YdeI/OmpD-associated family protein [uncultured Microbacterium sp.]
MSELRLHTTLLGRGPAAAIVLSDEQVGVLGAGKTFPVAVTVKGRTARLRLARMGGENMIGLSKAARGELGVEIGEDVEVIIAVDDGERAVEIPPTLAEAIDADPAVRQAFDALSYSSRKEHARAVAEAKQDATRDRRVAKIIEALRG